MALPLRPAKLRYLGAVRPACLETDLHSVVDFDLERVLADDVRHHARSLVEVDQRHDIGGDCLKLRKSRPVDNCETVNSAAPRDLGPFRVIGTAFGAEIARKEAQRAAVSTFLDLELILAGSTPIGRGIRVDDGFGQMIGHDGKSSSSWFATCFPA